MFTSNFVYEMCSKSCRGFSQNVSTMHMLT